MKKDLWDKIVKLNREGLKAYVLPGYKFNNWIFVLAVVIIIGWLVAAAWPLALSTETQVYVTCSNDSIRPCENPFYRENYVKMGLNPDEHCPISGLCEVELLQPGQSFGTPPNFFYQHMGLFGFLMVLLAFAVNHFIYNRDYKFELEVVDDEEVSTESKER